MSDMTTLVERARKRAAWWLLSAADAALLRQLADALENSERSLATVLEQRDFESERAGRLAERLCEVEGR